MNFKHFFIYSILYILRLFTIVFITFSDPKKHQFETNNHSVSNLKVLQFYICDVDDQKDHKLEILILRYLSFKVVGSFLSKKIWGFILIYIFQVFSHNNCSIVLKMQLTPNVQFPTYGLYGPPALHILLLRMLY